MSIAFLIGDGNVELIARLQVGSNFIRWIGDDLALEASESSHFVDMLRYFRSDGDRGSIGSTDTVRNGLEILQPRSTEWAPMATVDYDRIIIRAYCEIFSNLQTMYSKSEVDSLSLNVSIGLDILGIGRREDLLVLVVYRSVTMRVFDFQKHSLIGGRLYILHICLL